MNHGREPERFASLDALRGVAALLVLSFHCWKLGLFGDLGGVQWKLMTWTPLNLLVSGRPWVILFFVLSGFVLACSLERTATLDYRGFLIRRLCRVYLPFVASIALSVVLYELVRPAPIPELGRWFNHVGWDRDPALVLVLDHLLMTGVEGQDLLNPVMWSLVYELRISLVFPVLFLLSYRWPAAALASALMAFVGTVLLVGCRDLQCEPFRGADLTESALLTVYFAFFFVIGIVLARYRNPVRRRLVAMPPTIKAGLGLAAIYAMIAPGIPQLMRFLPADISFGIGAAAMIALAISGGLWQGVLETPVLGWFGRVSYSLYLTHNIVLLAVVHVLYGQVGSVALLGCVVVASVLVAWLCWRLVEAPSHRLGLRLARRSGAASMMPGHA